MSRPGRERQSQPTLPTHGASTLPSVEVESYNLEIEDEAGFVGDKATKGAFQDILESVRKALRGVGEDTLRNAGNSTQRKTRLNDRLHEGADEGAGAVLTES